MMALVGCASSDADVAAPASPTEVGDVFESDGVTVTGAAGSAPTVTIDTSRPAPEDLIVKEIYPGTGAKVKPNSLVTVQYVGSSWSTGQVFQSSWEGSGELQFPIQGVIPGWSQGLQGVQEGSRVLLIIPPDLAYGQSPPPGSGIEPNETLTFVVDVVKVG